MSNTRNMHLINWLPLLTYDKLINLYNIINKLQDSSVRRETNVLQTNKLSIFRLDMHIWLRLLLHL
jgi:hypothetical protein